MLGKATKEYTYEKSQFIKNVKDFSQGYHEISTYNAFSIFFHRNKEAINKMESQAESLEDKHAVVGFMVAMLSWFSYLIPISIALFFVIKGLLDTKVVIALFLASDRVISPFRNLSKHLRLLKSIEKNREKIKKIISDDDSENIVKELTSKSDTA